MKRWVTLVVVVEFGEEIGGVFMVGGVFVVGEERGGVFSRLRSRSWPRKGVLFGSPLLSDSESEVRDLLPTRPVVLEEVDSVSSGWGLPFDGCLFRPWSCSRSWSGLSR